ncbi:unnamed protein product [Didymodactylos carnosus]|uniref:Uncharacterized protein n=1 Tax=Didymodactylos carnosus TaxID=1234261 RepID=A0A814M6Z7_9BILA|nr:unnamed protein product [Didymodactylos carnosus]CAF3841517.1 unnamed protein product [Didymodactylos carnosus]
MKLFVHFHPTFHEVCSSQFVTTEWFLYISSNQSNLQFDSVQYLTRYRFKFSAVGPLQFQALASFCKLSKETINDALIQFNLSTLVTAKVLSRELFELQTTSIIYLFKLITSDSFNLRWKMIRSTTQRNQIITGLNTNYYPRSVIYDSLLENYTITKTQSIYPNTVTWCGCSASTQCGGYTFLDVISDVYVTELPTWHCGCLTLDGLLRSTLNCFYNNSECSEKIIRYMRNSTSYPMTNITGLYLTSNSSTNEK